jgi:hypothetical protein
MAAMEDEKDDDDRDRDDDRREKQPASTPPGSTGALAGLPLLISASLCLPFLISHRITSFCALAATADQETGARQMSVPSCFG